MYWGHYVAHDNNRDGIAQALQLSKVQMKNFLNWHPQVLHDLHESVPFLCISPGIGPYNAWLDPIVISEWQKMAYYEIEQMTERGVPGVWTHGYYDGWAPRGSLTDPDVIQGHQYEAPVTNPMPESPRERELYIDPDVRQNSRSSIPPESLWPRVVVRFAEERSLLISGELAGGQELANTPAVVDVPVGRGHVVLYAINPMWRQETQGSFMLVMNAAMNFDHLGASR